MRENILIQNFPFTPNEDLATANPMTIKQTLGVDVKFSITHRNGIRAINNGKPVSITARLTDRTKKDEILNAKRAKKKSQSTPQQPPVIHANKNKLSDKALKKHNISAKVKRDQIILGDGSVYQEVVPLIQNSDALQITPDEIQRLDEIRIKSTGRVRVFGNWSQSSIHRGRLQRVP